MKFCFPVTKQKASKPSWKNKNNSEKNNNKTQEKVVEHNSTSFGRTIIIFRNHEITFVKYTQIISYGHKRSWLKKENHSILLHMNTD